MSVSFKMKRRYFPYRTTDIKQPEHTVSIQFKSEEQSDFLNSILESMPKKLVTCV